MTSILERLEAEWDHDVHAVASHFHHDAPQPAAAPQPPQPEDTMSANAQLLDEVTAHTGNILNEVQAAFAKIQQVDRDAIAKAEAIKATPEGTVAFELLHALASASGTQPLLGTIGAILKGIADTNGVQAA